MARRGNNPRNPHLQVGSRLTSLFLIAVLALISPASHAASKSPTPKAKVSAKATAKATAKPAATKKATAKATAKPKPKKKVVEKKKKRAKVRITPSPKPVWPPDGFSVEGEVYAKIPTAKEFNSIISDDTKLANRIISRDVLKCTDILCGKVLVASEIGCIWWEVVSDVKDGKGTLLGTLTSAFKGSEPREVKTILLMSPESANQGGDVLARSVICHHEDRISSDPTNNYKKANT